MVKHKIKVGDIIWDDYEKTWGIVGVLPNKKKQMTFYSTMADYIIGYNKCEYDDCEDKMVETCSYCETTADEAYPLVPNRYFWGYMICLEINKNDFDKDHDYDYYCPDREENCWEFETA